jgi:hypothetical protein
LEFEVEGKEPVWIFSITIHAHPDVRVREYEHGVILANPSYSKYTFDIDELFPDSDLYRLKASPNQDLKVNNGKPVKGKVTLNRLDAQFLIKK